MQTVPSLVGSGTASAAAALGLVFAQTDVNSIQRPPPTRRGAASEGPSRPTSTRLSSAPVSSRPGTSLATLSPNTDEVYFNTLPSHFRPSECTSIPQQQRPVSAQVTPPRTNSRRRSFVRQSELTGTAVTENPRDSFSSNGSWMRRLSIRPLSQHGSFRSSAGPDSQSIAFSHGSAAPILSPSGSNPGPPPPNKLVKRGLSTHQGGPAMRRRAKSHLPTLRRPATSHQRSATLQQNQVNGDPVDGPVAPKYSFDQQIAPPDRLFPGPVEAEETATKESTRWTSFFHSRRVQTQLRGTSDRLLDRGLVTQSKRIWTVADGEREVYIIRGGVLEAGAMGEHSMTISEVAEPNQDAENCENTQSTPESTPPTKRARPSISMHFSSPTNLFSKTGSIRRSKRGAETKLDGIRNASAPLPSTHGELQDHLTSPEIAAAAHMRPASSQRQRFDSEPAAPSLPPSCRRNFSSPLPPLSRLSSFNVDLSRLGASAATQHPRSNQPSGSSQSSAAMASFRNSPRQDRSSTVNSSDMEVRGFNSGDDDETDFKSDTMFDSIRTTASGRNRTTESPAESIFDESPPSTAGNGKTKRLSIQEMLGRAWDADDKIMEEDESLPTPVRDDYHLPAFTNADQEASRPKPPRPSDDDSDSRRDLARFSLDDDFEEDWTRDDQDGMALSNHLSPPGSMNSRGVSPNLRFALANVNGDKMVDVARNLGGERPRSNIFDWTEPIQEAQDVEGLSARPRTVHGKQEMDLRGGRSSNRKGPSVAHVRSQSVPVVYDPSDDAKAATQKYGTWGLGTKGASEDWDDDFEFDGVDTAGDGDGDQCLDMIVPASIQASQGSLKQHSGQIRELSLLVNDLKRLCRHGRDLDMLYGVHASLWKEAEGIIALASPDEDELEGMDVESSEVDFEPSVLSERLAEDDVDVGPLKDLEDPTDAHELRLAKTTVIRERPAGRRRSVFSPDDDIFGGNKATTADSSTVPSRPKTPENNINLGGHDVTDMVKSVLDAMQQQTSTDSPRSSRVFDAKLHFGTNNLKALVKQASDLRDALSEIIRRADQITQSPARTPRRAGQNSPAFTRVFTPESPSSSPPKNLQHNRSNNSALDHNSHDASPSSGLSRRLQLMTVN